MLGKLPRSAGRWPHSVGIEQRELHMMNKRKGAPAAVADRILRHRIGRSKELGPAGHMTKARRSCLSVGEHKKKMMRVLHTARVKKSSSTGVADKVQVYIAAGAARTWSVLDIVAGVRAEVAASCILLLLLPLSSVRVRVRYALRDSHSSIPQWRRVPHRARE